MGIRLFWVWGCLFGLTSHRCHSAAISPTLAWDFEGLGCHVEPHGDGNQQVLIIPNVWYPAVPYASCFAPSCVPSKVSRVLLGGWPVGRPQILQGLAAQLRDLCNVLLSSTDPLQVVVAQGHEVTYHSGRWDGPKPCEPIVCASPCASSAWCSATPLQIQNPQMSAHCYQ